jgi:UDP-N-acetylglucosamine 2-epimerase
MLKVMTIVGTRPEIIRLSRTIAKLDDFCEHILVHTGQNYDFELNEVFFSELGIRKPDVFLEAAGENSAITIGRVIIAADKVIKDFEPDAILLLGDTNSSLSAISAKRNKVPIFHMEAGNRCFDFNVPEEINRRIVDHISDINLTYSQIAREYLIQEGFPPDQIIKTGSPMKEVLDFYSADIDSSSIVTELNLLPNEYFLISCHREENVDSPQKLQLLMNILERLIKEYNLPVIFSTHPRTKKQLENLKITSNPMIKFLKPFGFFDYVKLQINARCVLSDSGTITEESSILNFPALNLRETHERPEGFEEGSVMMVGLDADLICQSLLYLDKQPRGEDRALNLVHDYSANNVSEKVLRIIHSYTSFINKKVWHKQ